MRYFLQLIFILSACCVLTFCSSVPKNELNQPAKPFASQKLVLLALKHWQFSGKLGVTFNDEAISASIIWQQQDNNFSANIFGPLGLEPSIIKGDNKSYVITTKDNKKYYSNTDNDIFKNYFGFELPLSFLPYWAKGIPNPNFNAKILPNSNGYLAKLVQNNWQVEYLKYKNYDDISLPQKIIVSKDGLKLKLILSDWNI